MKHGFVVTHVGSGGTVLCRVLSEDLFVRSLGRTGVIYDHPDALEKARDKIDSVVRKGDRNYNDWYIDKILYNYEFTCKQLYKTCKFIYMVRSPLVPLLTLVSRGSPVSGAETYYLFRLRRMCEMAVKTGGALLTYEDLVSKKALPLLKTCLKLNNALSGDFKPLPWDDPSLHSGSLKTDPGEPGGVIPKDVLKKCWLGYERYLNFLERQTSLIRFAV